MSDGIDSLAAENTALRNNLDRHMEVIVRGNKANEALTAENKRLRSGLRDLLEFAIDSTCGKDHAVAEARSTLAEGENK